MAGGPPVVVEEAVAVVASNRRAMTRWLDRVPLRWWFIAGVAVLLAISALFGGLADADRVEAGPVEVGAGTEIVGPELTTTVRSAEISSSAPGVFGEAEEGTAYLVIEATVTNTWRVSTITFTDLLQLPSLGEEGAKAERVVLLSDNTTGVQAHPGVPVDVAFVWELPVLQLPDSTIAVSVMAKTLTEDGDVTYGSYWSDPEPIAIVTLTVEGGLG